MLRFAIKATVAASAVYYLKEEGIWKGSDVSLKAYDKLNTTLEPCITEVCKKLPVELPEIPKSEQTRHTLQRYWNKGVVCTFTFLGDLPEKVTTWTNEGVTAVMKHPDVKKLLD